MMFDRKRTILVVSVVIFAIGWHNSQRSPTRGAAGTIWPEWVNPWAAM